MNLDILREAHDAALSLNRGTIGNNVMYFETGQGAALIANAHHDVDQQTVEARSYAVAWRVRRCWSTRRWASSARRIFTMANKSPRRIGG